MQNSLFFSPKYSVVNIPFVGRSQLHVAKYYLRFSVGWLFTISVAPSKVSVLLFQKQQPDLTVAPVFSIEHTLYHIFYFCTVWEKVSTCPVQTVRDVRCYIILERGNKVFSVMANTEERHDYSFIYKVVLFKWPHWLHLKKTFCRAYIKKVWRCMQN